MNNINGAITRYSARDDVKQALLNFKTRWVLLGKLLTDVAYGGDYKEWGYDDFEVYCASELGLKKPTVKKLMVGYNYMKSYEGEMLLSGELKSIPDYQTVDLLKKAREREDIEETVKDELHRMAFEGKADEGVLRKEIRERMRPADSDDIDRANYNRRKEIDSVLRTARTLRHRVAEAKSVPNGLKARIEECLLELEALE